MSASASSSSSSSSVPMDQYHTPSQQTPRVRRPRLSEAPGSSPIIINLDMCEDELRKEIARQEAIIREQSKIIQDLKDGMEARMSESVLIETSNKITEQVHRVHEHDLALVETELASAREQLEEARNRLGVETATRRVLEREVDSLKRQLADRDETIASLQKSKSRLERRTLEWDGRDAAARIELDASRIATQSELASLKEQTRKLRDALAEQQKKSAEAEKKMKQMREQIEERERGLQMERIQTAETSTSEPIISSPEKTPRAIIRSVSNVAINIVQHRHGHPRSLEETFERLGALTVTNAYQQRENEQLRETIERLSKELAEKEEESESRRLDLESLHHRIVKTEGDADAANRYLAEEADKVKKQKADLRCELISLRREHASLQAKLNKLESEETSSGTAHQAAMNRLRSEKEREEEESWRLRTQLAEAQKKINELEEKLSEASADRGRVEVARAGRAEAEEKLETMRRSYNRLKEALQTLDDQVEEAMKVKNRFEAKWRAAVEETAKMRVKMAEMKEQMEKKRNESSDVVADRDRLKTKLHFLSEELRETHKDYREELAMLARQISEKKKEEGNENALQIQVEEMKNKKAQLESELRTAKRQAEQSAGEVASLTKQVSSSVEKERKLEEENTKQRRGLMDAVTKIEQYKTDAEMARELNHTLSESLAKAEERYKSLQVEMSDLEEVLKEKERLVSYLQSSQTAAKQLPKVSRKSTLLRQPTFASTSTGEITIVETEELDELENQRLELATQLEKKRNELTARRQEIISHALAPIQKPSAPASGGLPQTPVRLGPSAAAAPSAPSRAPLTPLQAAHHQRSLGVMRHDIPHRWKPTLGFGMRQMKCAACFEGVPRVRYAQRCLECSVIVHMQCAARVENTCGLPDQCATFYLDAHHTPTANMNGWIRLFRDDDPARKWRSAWTRLDASKIELYDDDCLAETEGARPFLSVDLSERERFSVRAAADAPQPEKEGVNCIHIHTKSLNLYMLAPTASARARWAESLQAARGRQLEVAAAEARRKSMGGGGEKGAAAGGGTLALSTLLLALDAPTNLSVNASFVLDDWLLIGAQEGLFVTSLSSTRVPFSVGGITSIYALEGAADIGMLIAIAGKQRAVALLSYSQLRAELSGHQPAARPQLLHAYEHVHLVAYCKVGNERFLCACNSTEINVLRYNDKRDIFTQHCTLPTNEPAMCLLPFPGGFYYGSDSFYSVQMDRGSEKPRVKALAPTHIADYPISVLKISENELLLAYQNHGRFVAPDGTPTRTEHVDWDQTPLEFCYSAPFLYVISYASLEIVQVAAYSGPATPAFLAEREIVKATGGHIVGKRDTGDILVVLASSSRTELHAFNAKEKRSTLKRKASLIALEKRGKSVPLLSV